MSKLAAAAVAAAAANNAIVKVRMVVTAMRCAAWQWRGVGGKHWLRSSVVVYIG